MSPKYRFVAIHFCLCQHVRIPPKRTPFFALSEVAISLEAKSVLRSKQNWNFAWSEVCISLGADFTFRLERCNILP